jgi:hypothetical protein
VKQEIKEIYIDHEQHTLFSTSESGVESCNPKEKMAQSQRNNADKRPSIYSLLLNFDPLS